MEDERRRGGSVVGPIILISAGVVFLLNNLGVIDWGVWQVLLQFWPILLIAIGLDILIGQRSLIGSLLVAVFLLGMLGVAVWLSQTGIGGRNLVTETINQPLEGATAADIEVNFGTGRLEIGPAPESNTLVEGSVALGPRERLSPQFRMDGNTAHYRLDSNQDFVPAFGTGVATDKVWDLRLNPDVPLRVFIDSGVGRSEIDLSQLQVTDFEMDGGVGEAEIIMPASGQVEASVDGGIGSVLVLIPQGMAARVQVNGGLGDVDVEGDFRQVGDEYRSSDYETAEDRVNLVVDGGIGKITVRRRSGG